MKIGLDCITSFAKTTFLSAFSKKAKVELKARQKITCSKSVVPAQAGIPVSAGLMLTQKSNSKKPHILKWTGYKRFLQYLLCISTLISLSTPLHAFSAYSNDELDELEREFVQQINQSDAVIRTPLAVEYINRLAKSLAQHGELSTPYFFIVKSNEINAFAGPGGYIGVNSALILATDNESELAAVMAHEMSHVRQHHLYRMLEHQKQMRVPMLASVLASIALGVINPTLASGALMGSMTGFAQDNINFVRSNEKEADSIGIDMLIKSGLDPRGMAGFFKKMQQNMRYYYMDNIPAILRTHPLDEERIAEAENRSQGIVKQAYLDNLDYRLFKELVRVNTTDNTRQLLDDYKKCPKEAPAIACRYGIVLTELAMNHPKQALAHINELVAMQPNNLFFAITQAHVQLANREADLAIAQLGSLQHNAPENYALLREYTDTLLQANKPDKAVTILLRGRQQFKRDLPLCNQLAAAEAAAHHTGYAYFTLAECHLLQGERRYAMQKLKTAKKLWPNDRILQSKIAAKMDEIKSMM